jgi:hypothetical protein
MKYNEIYTVSYDSPAVDRREILRYASCPSDEGAASELLDSALLEIEGKLSYRACFVRLPIVREGEAIDLSFAKTDSHSLGINLRGCDSIIVFCATVGVEMDRLIGRHSSLSPSRSVMLQAIGSERVEALCDLLCFDLAKSLGAEGRRLHPRFSPGYGDLPLELQRDIFRLLEPSRRIGVVLNDSLLMSPSKSVTAIIGIEKDN